MTQLEDLFCRKSADVDKVVHSLQGVKNPLTTKSLKKILDAHGRLVRIIQPVLRKGTTPRSFVSKYLHFHNSAVPIFDSVAVGVLKKLYRRDNRSGPFEIPATADKKYGDFLQRFWRLYSEVQKTGVTVSVKLLDNYLLAFEKDTK